MLQQQDNLVIWLLIFIGVILIARYLYKRYFDGLPNELIDPNDEIVQLLAKHGYTTLQRKIRVPISITIEEQDHFEARYYIDAIARKDGFTYAVKVGRMKRPMEYTNTSIRDHLFPIYLLASWDGILYIDKDLDKVTTFLFTYDVYQLPQKKVLFPLVIMFIFGVLVTLLLT